MDHSANKLNNTSFVLTGFRMRNTAEPAMIDPHISLARQST